jgi:hypothetical protein
VSGLGQERSEEFHSEAVASTIPNDAGATL